VLNIPSQVYFIFILIYLYIFFIGFRGKNKSEISGDLVKGIISSHNELLHFFFLGLCGRDV
jgi:hypothetical protein